MSGSAHDDDVEREVAGLQCFVLHVLQTSEASPRTAAPFGHAESSLRLYERKLSQGRTT